MQVRTSWQNTDHHHQRPANRTYITDARHPDPSASPSEASSNQAERWDERVLTFKSHAASSTSAAAVIARAAPQPSGS